MKESLLHKETWIFQEETIKNQFYFVASLNGYNIQEVFPGFKHEKTEGARQSLGYDLIFCVTCRQIQHVH